MKNPLPDHFHFRPANLKKDKDLILELECELNYENETHWKTQYDYTEYRQRWLSHGRSQRVYASFKKSCKERKTICEFMETISSEPVAFFMVTFQDLEGFGCCCAFLDDIYVYPRFRKQGIGSALLAYIEMRVKEIGAQSLSLGTGCTNRAANRLFEKNGFHVYRKSYEKTM